MTIASYDLADEDGIDQTEAIPLYSESVAGTLLAAREAVMAPLRIKLRKAHFTEAQWRVLRVLAEQGSSDGRTIARAALLHPPSVTRIIQELAKRGLIRRGWIRTTVVVTAFISPMRGVALSLTPPSSIRPS
jgi:hypothetical protein